MIMLELASHIGMNNVRVILQKPLYVFHFIGRCSKMDDEVSKQQPPGNREVPEGYDHSRKCGLYFSKDC